MTAEERARVLLLGYGEMGHAFEAILHDVSNLQIWDRHPQDKKIVKNLEDAVKASDFVIFCLPAVAHEEVLQRILPNLRPDTICLSIAKGLDKQGRCVAQLFTQYLSAEGSRPFALIYGPMISEEIQAGRVGFAELATGIVSTSQVTRRLFAGTRLILRESTDVIGTSWAVILKNVYAILFGVIDGLELGDNMRGYLSVAALDELSRIVRAMGGRPETVYSLAGLGDLITTATSASSHHHGLGLALARGERHDIRGEGVHTLEMVKLHHLLELTPYPLFQLAQQIVCEGIDPAEAFERYLIGISKL